MSVDDAQPTARGKLRLVCSECGNRFAIKSTRKPTSTPADLQSADGETESAPNLADTGEQRVGKTRTRRAHWTRTTEDAPTTVYPASESSASSAVSRDSSSVSPSPAPAPEDAPEETSEEAGFSDLADGEVALPGDPDEESGRPSFDELADGEVALPGDPDDEESEEASDVIQISVDADGDPSPSERPPTPGEWDAGAAGMSMEMSVPVLGTQGSRPEETLPPRTSEDSSPPVEESRESSAAEPPPGASPEPPAAASSELSALPEGSELPRELDGVVVTNLFELPGHHIEPIGMVTHHFCRPGGGKHKEARKRVRAFGIRYRRGLEEMAKQARQMGGDTVIGVEVILQPTGPAEAPIMWVLIQGTVGRRVPG